MAKIELQASDRFPVGTEVGAYRRAGDWFPANPRGLGAPVAKAEVNDAGVLKITGLRLGDDYWIAAEVEKDKPWVKVAMRATTDDGSRERPHRALTDEQANAQSVVPTNQQIPDPNQYGELRDEAGTIVDPVTGREERVKVKAEVLPEHLKQSDVPEGTPQLSDTLLGAATVIPPEGDEPEKQEDVPKRTRQRSDTKTGEAARKTEPRTRRARASRTKTAAKPKAATPKAKTPKS